MPGGYHRAVHSGFSKSILAQPRQSALHDPAMASETLLRLDASACDAWGDATLTQSSAAASAVVSLVRVQLLGTPSWPTAVPLDGGNCIDDSLQHAQIIHIGC